jgi:hypothetical protein
VRRRGEAAERRLGLSRVAAVGNAFVFEEDVVAL